MAAPEPAWAFQGRVGDGSLMTGPLTGAEGLGARLLTVGEGQVLGPGSLSEGRGQQRSLWSYGIQECLDYRVGAPLDPAETAERAVEHDAVAFPDPQCLEVMGKAIPGDGTADSMLYSRLPQKRSRSCSVGLRPCSEKCHAAFGISRTPEMER